MLSLNFVKASSTVLLSGNLFISIWLTVPFSAKYKYPLGNILLTLLSLIIIAAIYFFFPAFQFNLNDPVPDENLIPDPYFLGGGIHSSKKGGFLNIHTDFNWHHKLQLHRRVNVLIYLSKI